MKPFIKCRVYILTDSNGQWWEDIGQDGTTRRFKPGTSEFNDPKHFKNAKQAVEFAKKLGYTYYSVARLSPPVKPSFTWSEEVLEENLPKSTNEKEKALLYIVEAEKNLQCAKALLKRTDSVNIFDALKQVEFAKDTLSDARNTVVELYEQARNRE